MKKLLFLFAIIVGLPVSLFAQKKANSYIGLSPGISLPTFNYAKTDVNNPESGFGRPGAFIELNGAIFFIKNFGLGFSAGGVQGGFNDSAFVRSFNSIEPEYRHIKEFSSDAPQWSSVLIGPQFSIPVGNFHFDFRVQVGYASMTPQAFRFEYKTELGNEIFVAQWEPRTNGWGYKSGIAIRILKPVGITVSYDVVMVTEQVEGNRVYKNAKSTANYETKLHERYSYRKNIICSMIGIGLVYQFKRKE